MRPGKSFIVKTGFQHRREKSRNLRTDGGPGRHVGGRLRRQARQKHSIRNTGLASLAMQKTSIAARNGAIVLWLSVAAFSNRAGTGQAIGHTEVSVEGMTYPWPYDGSKDVGDPADWKHSALMPNRIWNETIGAVTGVRLLPNRGYSSIYLRPAKPKHWNIKWDGSGIPMTSGARYQKAGDHGSFESARA